MKHTLSIIRLAVLPALAVLSVSCGKKDEVAATNPYANNPYYGSEGNYGNYGNSDQASVTPAPAQDYVAPAPAAPNYTAPAPAPSTPSYASNTTSSRNHTVAKGDTLYSLSRRYGTTVNGIKSANGLSTDLITIGQSLAIP